MKRLFITLGLIILGSCCFAQGIDQSSPVQPQKIDFNLCNKYFRVDNHTLFYLTMSGLNENKFTIDEIKSRSGYILFTVAQKQYLASIIKIDSKNSLLKITPCDNKYFFPSGVVTNLFKYIELNAKAPIEKVQVL
jgi:hypothetical protein